MYSSTYIHAYIHAYIHTYMHACIHTYMYIYIYVPWTFRYNVITCFGFYFNSINTYQMSSLRFILCILLLEK